MPPTTVTFSVELPKKIADIIDSLIVEGDYVRRSDFILEAVRSHLNTWYKRKMNPEET